MLIKFNKPFSYSQIHHTNKLIWKHLINLFDEETDARIPGMIMHFTYEDFHPNHKLDIESKTREFISGWFKQEIDEHSWELAEKFILPNGITLSKDRIAKKLKNVFDSYKAFKNCQYFIDGINFELKEDTGMGYAEGAVKYTAVINDHENILAEGPFKLYFSLEYDWWTIYYFVFPGFEFPEGPDK